MFHNYGLGASAVAMAYGAAHLSVKNYSVFSNSMEAAIVGAGISGLSTAIELARLGRKVTVYASEIPDMRGKKMVKSGRLHSIWMPNLYDW